MKKALQLLVFSLLCFGTNAQNIIHVDVCTRYWSNAEPITACAITATVQAPGLPSETTVVTLDSTESCAGFDFDLDQYPPDAVFAFRATKDQDDPLNGVTMLDLMLMMKHILGTQALGSPFAMIAADANRSNSITTYDLVETRKLIMGTYSTWPNAPVWRFIPEYQLPFPNPNNPFQGSLSPGYLTLSQMQALNGGLIGLAGTKTGDVDGDANTLNGLLGTGSDSLALKIPDLTLVAGVPTSVPISMTAMSQLAGMQFEISSIPGVVVFDTITVDPAYKDYFTVKTIGSGQNSKIRAVMLDHYNTLSGSPVMYLHLRANATISLKDALQIQQAGFYSMGLDDDSQLYRLYLDFSNATNTQDVVVQNLQVIAVSPNPFADQAQVEIELKASEMVMIELMDPSGKLLVSEKYSLNAGSHILPLPVAPLANEGVILYRISTDETVVGGTLLRRK